MYVANTQRARGNQPTRLPSILHTRKPAGLHVIIIYRVVDDSGKICTPGIYMPVAGRESYNLHDLAQVRSTDISSTGCIGISDVSPAGWTGTHTHPVQNPYDV